jgi:hypothetical protein
LRAHGGASSEPFRAQEGTFSSVFSPDDSVAATTTSLRCEEDGRECSGAAAREVRRGSGFELVLRQREPQREMVAAAMGSTVEELEVWRWWSFELGVCVKSAGECG